MPRPTLAAVTIVLTEAVPAIPAIPIHLRLNPYLSQLPHSFFYIDFTTLTHITILHHIVNLHTYSLTISIFQYLPLYKL